MSINVRESKAGDRGGLPSRYKLSYWGDENILKLACGDGRVLSSENTPD